MDSTNVPPPPGNSRPYNQGLFNHWIPLIRPYLRWGGGRLTVDQPLNYTIPCVAVAPKGDVCNHHLKPRGEI